MEKIHKKALRFLFACLFGVCFAIVFALVVLVVADAFGPIAGLSIVKTTLATELFRLRDALATCGLYDAWYQRLQLIGVFSLIYGAIIGNRVRYALLYEERIFPFLTKMLTTVWFLSAVLLAVSLAIYSPLETKYRTCMYENTISDAF
jgi:hypothetical protein